MNDIPVGTILFEGVSKRYRLGALGTLRSTLAALASRGREDSSRDFWALKEVSFRVDPGESLGLIGPNGAGKTTTLKLLSNITQPTEGRIQLNGRLSSLIELGAGFHPELSGRDNIFLNGAILGLKRREIQRKLDAIIAFSELERFIDTPVKRYSSGMYVRLGFAVAAHVEPDVLLVDEVLAVGDASFRHRCMLRMQQLRENGTTLLFVSHNMHMVRKMCTRAILLRHGQLCAQGSAADMIALYDKLVVSGDRSAVAEGRDLAGDDDGEVRLNHVSIASTVGDIAGSDALINSESPVIVRIGYQADRAQAIGRIDIRMIRDDGTLCIAIDSQAGIDRGVSGLDEVGKQGEIRVTLDPIQLTTGRYFALVQITDPTDASVVASGQSEYFAVFTQNAVPNPGIFLPHSQWQHDTLA